MAFPVDAARATTNGSTAATNKVCNLPTGIVSGDRLVLILRSAAADTHSTPTGWTLLALNNADDASNDTTSVWYRVADGTEGGTVTVNGTASLKFAAICWRITGAGTPQLSATATGTSATPDPPSFTPTGGAQDYLWLWLGGWEGEQTSPPAGNPTNYVNPTGADSGIAGAIATNCRVAGASRQLNAATEDSPSWTISVSDDWTTWTLAVPPPAVATFFQTLAATAIGVAGLATVTTRFVSMSVVAIGAATLTPALVVVRAVNAVSVGVATLTTVRIFAQALAALAIAAATFTRIVTYTRTLVVVATGMAAIAKTIGKTLAATAIAVPTLTKFMFNTLAATTVGIASLTSTFIEGATQAAFSLLYLLMRNRKR